MSDDHSTRDARLRLELDPGVEVLDDGRTLLGGDPAGVLRLDDTDATAVRALLAGADAPAPALRALAGRLLDLGLAHPAPDSARGERLARSVTVVVPVRDREQMLDRCLTAFAAATGPVARLLVVDDGSRDPDAIARVAQRHGGSVLRREQSGGPAAARNLALRMVDSDLVAFLDSDTVPTDGWLTRLCEVIDVDADVVAVGARMVPLRSDEDRPPTVLRRYLTARSPLDKGPRPGPVRPGARVSHLPTAALLVRRAAIGDGFDEALRYGEDVDLMWRLLDAGRRIRYAPGAVVGHQEPTALRPWLNRGFVYATAAGPLHRRHPGRVSPASVSARQLPALVLALAGRPGLAAAALGPVAIGDARRLGRVGVSPRRALAHTTRDAARTGLTVARATRMLAPGLLLLAGLRGGRRGRGLAVAATLAGPLRDWLALRPPLDPVRWTAIVLLDDAAHGAGVWVGAVRARTVGPLRPTIVR